MAPSAYEAMNRAASKSCSILPSHKKSEEIFVLKGASKDSVPREPPQLEETQQTSEGVMPTDKEVGTDGTCVFGHVGDFGCNFVDAS